MKTLLAALLLFPLPAFAQQITIGYGATTQTWSLTPADAQKFEQWVQYAYPCQPQPDCTPNTLAQSMALWEEATMQGTMDNVARAEKIKLASDAVKDVPPITPSKTGKAK